MFKRLLECLNCHILVIQRHEPKHELVYPESCPNCGSDLEPDNTVDLEDFKDE